MMYQNESDMLSNTMVVVLADESGSRLGDLTSEDCKPALPFGAVLKNIDLTLSNCLNSHLKQVGVVLQRPSTSLLSHLQSAWAPLRVQPHFTVTPWQAESDGSAASYPDTVDAVLKNWPRITQSQPRWVMILAGNPILKMDLRRLLSFHIKKGADATLACVKVPLAEATRFVVVTVEEGCRISDCTENPAVLNAARNHHDKAFVSMGIYVFNTDVLRERIGIDNGQIESTDDFSRDIIPNMITSSKVIAYPFSRKNPGGGYWHDVNTLNDYWTANMELLGQSPRLSLYDSAWPLHGCTSHRANNWIGTHYLSDATKISNSLIAADCDISSATISHAVVSPNVRIGYCSSIHESIIHPNASIGSSCRLHGVIVRSNCHIPDGKHFLNSQWDKNQLKFDWSPIVVTERDCVDQSIGCKLSASQLPEVTGLTESM